MKTKSWLAGALIALFVVALTGPAFAECWSAIAVNTNKRTAKVATGPTLADAQFKAMQEAGMPGSSIWTWAKDKFIAMAADQNNPSIFGMSTGASQQEADQNAMNMCQKMKGQSCKVVTRGGCTAQQNPSYTPQPAPEPARPGPGPGPGPTPLPENQKFKW